MKYTRLDKHKMLLTKGLFRKRHMILYRHPNYVIWYHDSNLTDKYEGLTSKIERAYRRQTYWFTASKLPEARVVS